MGGGLVDGPGVEVDPETGRHGWKTLVGGRKTNVSEAIPLSSALGV